MGDVLAPQPKKKSNEELLKMPPATEGRVKETKITWGASSNTQKKDSEQPQTARVNETLSMAGKELPKKVAKNAKPEVVISTYLALDKKDTEKTTDRTYSMKKDGNVVEVNGSSAKITSNSGQTTTYDLTNSSQINAFNNKLKELNMFEEFYRGFKNWLNDQLKKSSGADIDPATTNDQSGRQFDNTQTTTRNQVNRDKEIVQNMDPRNNDGFFKAV